MATLQFTKMHGCGNDYIFVVATSVRPADPVALSTRLSDRHFGIGGDGLILLAPSNRADIMMEMYNADGSRGDMCGNGIRCLARLAFERGIVRANPMIVETDAGLKTVLLQLEGRRVIGATVDMGEPILDGREIPVNADGRIIDYPLEVAGRRESITAVSMRIGLRRTRPRSKASRATHRIPLPHISPRLPSALYISIRMSARLDGASMIRPSPPIPKWRSESLIERAAGSAGRARVATM